MESLYILYLLVWRLTVVLCGALAIYLGFRLFVLGFEKASSEIEAKHGDYSVSFRNFAPGTAFALFGAALIGAMVAFSPAEISVDQNGNLSRTALNFRGDVADERPAGAPAGGLVFRGDEEAAK